jgi:hypothetical protein
MENAKQLVVVFNTVEPYGYELVNLLAYPDGFTTRFRFEDDWVDASLGIPEKNTLGYIVLRNLDTSKLFPVRRFLLLNYSKIGSIHYLQCVLGELFAFDSDEGRRATQLDEFNKSFGTVRTEIETTNKPGEHMRPLVFMSSYDPPLMDFNSKATESDDKNNERWANFLSVIRDIDFYKDVEFLRIVQVSEQECPDRRAPVKDHSYILKRSLNYEVVVAQYRPSGLGKRTEPRDIKLQCDDKNVISVRPRQRAVGKYDILSFILRIDRKTRIKKSFFDLEFTPTEKLAPYVNPLIQVPIKINSPMRLVVIDAILTVILVGFYLFPAIWIQFLPLDVFGRPAMDFGRDLSLVTLAVTITDLIAEIRNR